MLAVVLLPSLLVFGCAGQERAVVARVNEVRVACDNGQTTACIDYQTIQQESSDVQPSRAHRGIKCHRCRAAEVIC